MSFVQPKDNFHTSSAVRMWEGLVGVRVFRPLYTYPPFSHVYLYSFQGVLHKYCMLLLQGSSLVVTGGDFPYVEELTIADFFTLISILV